jgi:hypothetical protein
MLFICLTGFWDEKFRNKILLAFQRMMRARTKERFDECRELVQKTKANVWGDEKRADVINYLWPPFDALGFGHLATLPDHALDLAFSGLVSIAQRWRSMSEGPFEVVHDRSSNMARQAWLCDKLSAPDLEAANFPGLARRRDIPAQCDQDDLRRLSERKADTDLRHSSGCYGRERPVAGRRRIPEEALATFRRKIDVFGIAVNGADKAEPAQDIGRDVKISDGLLQAARGRRLAFPSRGRC